ncbi:MAG: GNAT family N-acetyltransferase [Alphaproteobacteria bacterium]|mgnify:CR=1 FL=1|nr:GNAT family N-acetyltransferase [Alphaproteobacteria bacterium]
MPRNTMPANWIIRAAEKRDAPFLGWACVAAARSHRLRGWFDIVLRRDEAFVNAYATALTLAAARSWWHWSLFRVADIDGVVVSAMCGFGDESVYYKSSEAMAEASAKMDVPKAEHAQYWTRGAFIVSTATSERNAWTIENVATRAENRGAGVTLALVESELDVARAAGFKRAQVSFFIGNTPAERLYGKAGFVFAEEKRAADFEAAMGTPGTIRFARDL